MAFEDCTVYRVWDHEERDWWVPHTQNGYIKFWDTEGKARGTMSRKLQGRRSLHNYTKEQIADRFTIIECHVVPKPDTMALFREL